MSGQAIRLPVSHPLIDASSSKVDDPLFETVDRDTQAYLIDGIVGDGNGVMTTNEERAALTLLGKRQSSPEGLMQLVLDSLRDPEWRKTKNIDDMTWNRLNAFLSVPNISAAEIKTIIMWLSDYERGLNASDESFKATVTPHWATYGDNQQRIFYYKIEPASPSTTGERKEVWLPGDGTSPTTYAVDALNYVRQSRKTLIVVDRVDGVASAGEGFYDNRNDDNWDYNSERADALQAIVTQENLLSSDYPLALTGHSAGTFWKLAWYQKYGEQYLGKFYFMGMAEDSGGSREKIFGLVTSLDLCEHNAAGSAEATYTAEHGLPTFAYSLVAGGNLEIAHRFRVVSTAGEAQINAVDWALDCEWSYDRGYYWDSFSPLRENGVKAPQTYIVDLTDIIINRNEQIPRFSGYQNPGTPIDFFVVGLADSTDLSESAAEKQNSRLVEFLSELDVEPTTFIKEHNLMALNEPTTIEMNFNNVPIKLHFYPTPPSGHLTPSLRVARDILWKQTLASEAYLKSQPYNK